MTGENKSDSKKDLRQIIEDRHKKRNLPGYDQYRRKWDTSWHERKEA